MYSQPESKTLQETPEESYYRQNLGQVSPVEAVVAALSGLLSQLLIHLTTPVW